MSIKTPEDLKLLPLYEQAAQEVEMITEGLPDVRWPTAVVKTLLVAMWLRGASWKASEGN
jgi:hypothetical protein